MPRWLFRWLSDGCWVLFTVDFVVLLIFIVVDSRCCICICILYIDGDNEGDADTDGDDDDDHLTRRPP